MVQRVTELTGLTQPTIRPTDVARPLDALPLPGPGSTGADEGDSARHRLDLVLRKVRGKKPCPVVPWNAYPGTGGRYEQVFHHV